MTAALDVRNLNRSFGALHVTRNVDLSLEKDVHLHRIFHGVVDEVRGVGHRERPMRQSGGVAES